jgi:Mg2+-importing ATPase
MVKENKRLALSVDDLFAKLNSSRDGLSPFIASERMKEFGENTLPGAAPKRLLPLIWSQFKSPLILLLVIAAVLSAVLGDTIDAFIIVIILISSNILQFWQEHQANDAIERLLKMVQIKATVRRDGQIQDIPLNHIVPGDVVILNAGDMVPGDCKLYEIKDLFIDESSLTGESFPSEKSQLNDSGYFGTHVISGKAQGLIYRTGKETQFGEVAKNVQGRNLETAFEKGIKSFSLMLMQMTLLILSGVLLVNLFFHKPLIDSLLFALALAIGMTPQLLPATVSMTLALGARRLAEKRVIVKRLSAIQNLGAMTVLCCDKTGTLTEGKMRLSGFMSIDQEENRKVLEMAVLNARLQSGFNNPIDDAIIAHSYLEPEGFIKVDEIPYDFNRKRLTVAVKKDNKCYLITKGAFQNILSVCERIEEKDEKVGALDLKEKDRLQSKFEELSADGHKVLAIAYKELSSERLIGKDDETEMTFLGLLVFEDPLKSDAMDSIKKINRLGVEVKIISGDNRFTVDRLTKDMGFKDFQIMTGEEIAALNEDALAQRAIRTHAFAEIDPNQKEALLRALQRAGEIVGFLGDGINDSPALHKADVGISVDGAVDIAKSAASIVLLEKDLSVLSEGILEGRRIFANCLKYIFITTSANFGNMFSMAATSLFLPFLPLLPKQIMFNNLLTDIPALAIGSDAVDDEELKMPKKWDMKFIKRFMIFFGLHSSFFDLLTFYLLYSHLKATPEQFRTAWFIESSISEIMVLLIIRTHRSAFLSRPSRSLLITSLLVMGIALLLPLILHDSIFGFVALSNPIWSTLGMVLAAYVISAEAIKFLFLKLYLPQEKR